MLASHRFIFSTFLFLALSCFAVSSAFAATEFVYYSSSATQFCSTDPSSVCAKQNSSTANYTYTHNGSSSISSDFLICRYTLTQFNYNGPGRNEVSTQSTTGGVVLKKTCQDGETFKLDGCTATCEVDPCKSKQGQKESVSVQCGTASCSSGVTVSVGSSAFTCSAGVATFSPQSPTGNAVKDACAMVGITSEDLPTLADARAKTEDLGSSSVPMYCNYTYEYTGKSGGQDTPLNNASLTLSPFSGAIPPDGQGNCDNPDFPIKGIKDGQTVCYPQDDGNDCPVQGEKPNSNGVCVGPNDPTYPKDGEDPNKDPDEDKPNTCPTGQIKNNSGVCVPYGDATNCPVGQVRSNLGTCITDPKANSCPSGQIKNLAGACVPNPKGTGCADGSTPNANGVCANGVGACPVGQTRNASGVCVTTSPSSGCKDGSTPNASGICSDGSGACPVGKIRNASGACVSDPDDPDSSKSASLASNCETAPECDGDPIQCAIYHHQWKSNCDAIRAPDENEKAQIRGAIEDTNSQIDGRENEYKDSINAIIADSGLLNNPVPTTAQCIPDKTINIMGGVSVTVPYSLLCPYFSLLRSMLIMVAYLFAARIIYAELTGGGIRV